MDSNIYAKYKASVIVTSDTCSKDVSKDESGEFVVNRLKELGFSAVEKHIVPDERDSITGAIINCTRDKDRTLLITVGGTGLCPRDVTPETCKSLYQKECGSIAIALLTHSLRRTPHSALSRISSGIIDHTLVVNFPGKLKACGELLSSLETFLEHALEQVKFDPIAFKNTHLKLDKDKPKSIQSIPTNNFPPKDNEVIQSKITPIASTDCPSPTKGNTNGINLVSAEEVNRQAETRAQKPCFPVGSAESTFQVTGPAGPAGSPNSTAPSYPQTSSISISSLVFKNMKTQSPYELIEYGQALKLLGSMAHELCQNNVETVVLDSAEAASKILGHVLAKDLCSLKCIPPYKVSTMDGYVVNIPRQMRSIVAKSMITALVRQVMNYEQFEIMRKMPQESENLLCYPINTGGRVPEEDIAVVPVEDTDGKDDQNRVKISRIKLNCYTRATGSDLNLEDCLARGTKIGPLELSLIVAMGHKSVDFVRKPVISIMSTGDELVSFQDQDASRNDPTKVLDVNEPLLAALFYERGFKVLREGIVKDNFEAIKKKIVDSLSCCDVLLITGGASMGTKDFVKDALEALGCKIHFGRVNIKPGKPAAFASVLLGTKRKFIFSLPGNPVSAYITSQILVLPFIESGMRNFHCQSMSLSMTDIGQTFNARVSRVLDDTEAGYYFEGRLEFLRARLASSVNSIERQSQAGYQDVEVSIRQQSSRLLSLKDCDCLVLVNKEEKGKRLAVNQLYKAIRLIK